jgi:broad specificity phosphatase PhoE
MTTFFLVRHAAHRHLGQVLVGRMAGVELEQDGHAQADRLAARLKSERVTAVLSSPRERARMTAAPIARRSALPVEIASALDEIEMGDWTGRPFRALDDDLRWQHWNSMRGKARPPGGESMADLQARMLRHLRSLESAHHDGRIVLVSHAEPIRAALLHYLEMSLDDFTAVEIDPASISTITIDDHGSRVISLNETVPS